MGNATEEYYGPLAEPFPANEPETTRRDWRLERVGWLLVALLVLAALAGLLSHGPLSWASTESSEGGIVLDHQRLVRHNADEQVRLELGPSTVEDGTIAVELRGSWVEAIRVDAFVPEPSAQRTVPGGVLLEFEVEDVGSTVVTLYYRAFQHGSQEGEISVGQDRLSFSQWILP